MLGCRTFEHIGSLLVIQDVIVKVEGSAPDRFLEGEGSSYDVGVVVKSATTE